MTAPRIPKFSGCFLPKSLSLEALRANKSRNMTKVLRKESSCVTRCLSKPSRQVRDRTCSGSLTYSCLLGSEGLKRVFLVNREILAKASARISRQILEVHPCAGSIPIRSNMFRTTGNGLFVPAQTQKILAMKRRMPVRNQLDQAPKLIASVSPRIGHHIATQQPLG